MAEARIERRLAAILAADVAGYSRLMGADEVGTLAALKAHRREIVDPAIAAHNGRIVKTTGDGMLVEFASAVDAVTCAVAVQEKMAERTAKGTERCIQFRVGINVGDIIIDRDDIFGDGVNVAARVENECEPGGVCLSGNAFEQVRGKTGFAFDDLGERSLKNIDRPVRLYAVRSAAFSTETAAKAPAEAEKPLALPDKPSIAVLPFQNMSGDAEQEYFADGIVEDIITALSRVHWLFVIARNSSFTYKGKPVDVKRVGRELGVRYVLEGSVRKAGNRVRITGQLVDATTGAHVWADHFDGALDDIFDLQDGVTASVAGTIEPRLQQAEIERAGRKPTESLDAYDYFLRGMASFHLFTKDGLLEARRLLQRATELDPNYASAYGMAAWCIHLSKTNAWLAEPEREIAEGVSLARRAVTVGKDDPTALWSGGHSLAYLAREIESGAAYIDRALVLNPNLAAAWSVSGWLRIYLGEPAKAIEHLERAGRLSPLDPIAYLGYAGRALAHLLAGRYDEAVSWATKARHEQPNWATSLRVAAIAYALSDRTVEAQEAMARLREIDPTLRLSNLERVAPPLQRPVDSARFVEGLRKAGLPE
jgi:adenylate cyclase